MSRFSSLEFSGEEDKSSGGKTIVKDERFYLLEAKTAFEQARFEEGLRSYSKVLEYNPDNVTAWAGQVRMLIEMGEFPEAKLWADKALEKFPREPELLAAKAVALGRLGDHKGALAFSDAAIEERGETPYIWLARADVLMARREERAEFCFQKAQSMAANDWFTHWLAARIYFYYRKFALALRAAQEALNLNAGQSAVWLQMGLCQMELGLAGLAENSLSQAKQLNPFCQQTEAAIQTLSQEGFWSRLSRRLFKK
jgi:tetratricopeptide (TPR) repeat protein